MASDQSGLSRKPAMWAGSAFELLGRLGRPCSNEGGAPNDLWRRQRVPLKGRLAPGLNCATRAA
eukprot:15439712-Alexandrium_andersonii.AAC.1